MIKTAIIRKVKNKYFIYSKKKNPKTGRRKRLGGPYSSRDAAKKRLREIETFKHMHADDGHTDDKSTKTIKGLSDIAGYLEDAGFIDAADKVYVAMAAVDGSFEEDYLIDGNINTDEQLNLGGGRGFVGGSIGQHQPSFGMDIAEATMIKALTLMANKLDSKGLYKLADEMDQIIKSAIFQSDLVRRY